MSGYDSNTLLYMTFDYSLSVDRAQNLNGEFQDIQNGTPAVLASAAAKKKFGNNSIEFTGVSPQSYISTDSLTIPKESFSVDFWYYVHSNSAGNPYIFQLAYSDESARPTVSGEDDPREDFLSIRYILTSNEIQVLFFTCDLLSFASNANAWNHILLQYTYTNKKITVFHNGSQVGQATHSTTMPASTQVNIILHDSMSQLTGYLDEIRIQKGVNATSNFEVPSKQYSADVITHDLGTINSGDAVDLEAIADGMHYEYSTTTVTETDPDTGSDTEVVKSYIGNGKTALKTPGGSAETILTFTPSQNMELVVDYSLTSGSYNRAYITLDQVSTETTIAEDQSSSETITSDTFKMLSSYATLSDPKSGTLSQKIKKGSSYTLKLKQDVSTTPTYAKYVLLHSFKIFEIRTQQPFKKYDYGLIQGDTIFDLASLADEMHFNYDKTNDKIISGSTSYHIRNGVSRVFFKFIPAYIGVLNINCQISAHTSCRGIVTISPAQRFDPETQEIEELAPPTPTYAQANSSNTSVLNGGSYIVNINGIKAAKDYTSIKIESGASYWIGVHYLRNTTTYNVGDDRFTINSIQYERTTSDTEYVAFPDGSGKIKSFPVKNDQDEADLTVCIIKNGEIKKGGLVASDSSDSVVLKTARSETAYGFLKDNIEEIAEPSIANSSNVFNKSEISVVWNNIDDDIMYVAGETSGIDARNYDAFVCLKDREKYRWAGKDASNQVHTWKITAAPTSVTCDTDVTIDVGHAAKVQVTRNTNTYTNVQATTSNNQIATSSISGNYLYIKGVSEGTAQITVYQKALIKQDPEDTDTTFTNVTQSPEKKINVNVVPKIYHLPEIIPMLESGSLFNTFNIGDCFYLELGAFKLEGSGDTPYEIGSHVVYATIIGYNHNPEIEGALSVHLQLGSLDRDNTSRIAYASGSINKTKTYEGGWLASNMRETNMPAIQAALPSSSSQYYFSSSSSGVNNWKTSKNIQTIKYVNNTGKGNTMSDHVISHEHLFLPSYVEIFGSANASNSGAEKAYNRQYSYYTNGTSTRIRKSFNGNDLKGTTNSEWLTRSRRGLNEVFSISSTGTSSYKNCDANSGVSPIIPVQYGTIYGLSWNMIAYLAEQNMLQNYAAIGDYKPFTLTGAINGTTVTGDYLATIVAFEHNPDAEGTGRATFGIKYKNGSITYKKVFVDSHYDIKSYTDTTFAHCTQGGWKSSNIKKTCKKFFDLMPEDLKSVIVSQHKYTDNLGGFEPDNNSVTVTTDKLWIPSEYEVFGKITHSNEYEKYAQAPYSGYFNNASTRYGYRSGSTKTHWYLRSHAFNPADPETFINKYCIVNSNASSADANYQESYISSGIALFFSVGGQKETVWTDSSGSNTRTYTWQEVKDKIVAGNTDNFAIGDTFTIQMDSFSLDYFSNSVLTSSTVDPGKLVAVIIGIDHNSDIEGSNRVHFQIMRYSHDTLIKKGTGYVLEPNYIKMSFGKSVENLSDTNVGGWRSSYIRRKTMSDLFAALPESLRRVITPVKKYTDNVGGNTGSKSENISHTYDRLFLPSEYEIMGTITMSNTNEASYQKRYEYYETNSAVSYRRLYHYFGTADKVKSANPMPWFLRSPTATALSFTEVAANGTIKDFSATDSVGVPVCFTIGQEDTIDTTKVECIDESTNTLSLATVDKLRSCAYNGTIQNYFSIGDEIDITLSDFYLYGSDGYHAIHGETYQAVIIGFDHNSAIEGDKTIHFMICRKGGLSIAFPGASMGSEDNNTGGWGSSKMFTENMNAVYNAMPSAWKNIITTCPKYSDNTGNSSGTETDILNNKSSKMWLPSFFEIYGTTTMGGVVMASPFEADHQQQYSYFKTIIKSTEALSDATIRHYAYDGDLEFGRRIIPCWTRSTAPDSSEDFSLSIDKSSSIKAAASKKYGITPCFMIKGTLTEADIIAVTPPTVSGLSFTYNDALQGPMIIMSEGSEDQIQIINAKAVTADTYTLEIELKDKTMFKWSDTNDTENKTYNYTINRANGSFSLSSSSVACTAAEQVQTVQVTRSGNGTVLATSCDTSIASTIVTGTTITIQGNKPGTTRVAVTIAQGTNHKAVTTAKYIEVTVEASTRGDAYSWKQIAEMSADGTIFNYLKAGDQKRIEVRGEYQGITISGTYNAVLLSDSYHNASVEGSDTSQWAIAETVGGTRIAFVTSNYGNSVTDGSPDFAHKLASGIHQRGWQESYIREFLNTEFINFLPLDLRSYLSAVTKYSNIDTVGDVLVETKDKLWIPSGIEFNPTGATAARLGGKQYKYSLPSSAYYRHDLLSSQVWIWTRSSSDSNIGNMRFTKPSNVANARPNVSYGIIPCFGVGRSNYIDFTTLAAGASGDLSYGTYQIKDSAVITESDGIFVTEKNTVTFNWLDEYASAKNYSVTMNLKIPTLNNVFTCIVNGIIFNGPGAPSLYGGPYTIRNSGTNVYVIAYDQESVTNTWFKIKVSVQNGNVFTIEINDVEIGSDTKSGNYNFTLKNFIPVIPHNVGDQSFYVKDLLVEIQE